MVNVFIDFFHLDIFIWTGKKARLQTGIYAVPQLTFLWEGLQQMHVSVWKDAKNMNTESSLFRKQMDGSIFLIDSFENKIVGFNKTASADQWQDTQSQHQVYSVY